MYTTNLQEPYGNFKNIFKLKDFTYKDFLEKVNQTGKLLEVEIYEYFKDTGNGMNPTKQKEENDKIIDPTTTNTIERAQTALKFLEQGNHIGVSDEQFQKDLMHGKNHDETMKYFLNKIIANQELEPCVVVKTEKAKEVFGPNVNKVILDGTHRAVIASLCNFKLNVLEFEF